MLNVAPRWLPVCPDYEGYKMSFMFWKSSTQSVLSLPVLRYSDPEDRIEPIQGICPHLSSRYSDLEYRVLNRVISDISVVLGETNLTFSDSIATGSPVESEIVRVISLSTTEMTEITRFITPFSRSEYLEVK